MNDTDQLARLLHERHEKLSQVAYLSRRQMELIESGDLGTLLQILGGKQQLLGDLNLIERSLDPFRNQNPEQRHWSDPAARERSAQLAAESDLLLGEIFQLEQRSAGGLQQRRDEAAQRLQGLHTAHEARGAYLAQPEASSYRQLDLSTEV
jgi:hypothetical protein